jgi:hypothetical protein
VLANVRWEVVFALVGACLISIIVGLVLWMWMVWLSGLLALLATSPGRSCRLLAPSVRVRASSNSSLVPPGL